MDRSDQIMMANWTTYETGRPEIKNRTNEKTVGRHKLVDLFI